MAAPAAAAAASTGFNWAGLASGVGKVLGGIGSVSGLFGSGGDNSDFVNHAIQKRVRDAKAAGVHPLFALGSTISMPGMPTTGNAYGDSLSALGAHLEGIGSEATAMKKWEAEQAANRKALKDADDFTKLRFEAEQRRLALDEARFAADKRSNEAQAAYYDSLTRLNAQKLLSSGHDVGATFPAPVKVVPDRQKQARSNDASKTAGTHPGFREVVVGRNWDGSRRTMLIPDQDIAESERAGDLMYLYGPAMQHFIDKTQPVYDVGVEAKRLWDKSLNYWKEKLR